MPTPRPWEERLTPIDLFEEKNRVTTAWKILASLSTWLIGIGCLLYPFAVPLQDSLKLRYSILIVSLCLAIAGHVLEAIVVLKQKYIMFWLEDLIIPNFNIVFMTGIVAPLFHIVLRPFSTAMPLIGLFILSGVSAALHIPALVRVKRRIDQIKQADLQRRQRVAASPSSPWPSRLNSQRSGASFSLASRSLSFKRSHSRGKTSPSILSSIADDSTYLLPEDEAQRQQLMKLLMRREDDTRPPVVTGPQGGGVQTTYRLDLPTPEEENEQRRHLTVPHSYGPNRVFPTYSSGSSREPPNADNHLREDPPRDNHQREEFTRDNHIREDVPRHNPRENDTYASSSSGDISSISGTMGYEIRGVLEQGMQGGQRYSNPVSHSTDDHFLRSPVSNTMLQPSLSQIDRERRRQEIEMGETHVLPPYEGEGIPTNQLDQKGAWLHGNRHGN